jgi:hypothetical protein
LVARKLMDEGGYDVERQLIIRMQGSDRDLMRASIGVLAATPLPNTDKPVTDWTY